eukprot:6197999-Pleurochrysis_carterae.AAC.5
MPLHAHARTLVCVHVQPISLSCLRPQIYSDVGKLKRAFLRPVVSLESHGDICEAIRICPRVGVVVRKWRLADADEQCEVKVVDYRQGKRQGSEGSEAHA